MSTKLAISLLLLSFLPFPSSASIETPTMGDVAALRASSSDETRFTIITTNGHVSFTVPSDWEVISMQSKPPVAVAGFQIPNPADSDTPDATNVSVSLIQENTEKGKNALSMVGKSYEGVVAKKHSAGWDYFSQEAHQGDTLYTILDAKKPIADVVVAVRLAWPHLAKNPSQYDGKMNAVFDRLLNSLDGGMGNYPVKQGEVIRRQAKQ